MRSHARAHDFDIDAYVDAFERKPKRGPADYTTMEMLAYASAYSPRSATAFDLELPFDQSTGELREDVFARWLAFDPAERVVQGRDALARLRLRYLDCGRRDEYNLDIGARVVAERIRGLGLAVRHEEFDDDHRNIGYRTKLRFRRLPPFWIRNETIRTFLRSTADCDELRASLRAGSAASDPQPRPAHL